MVHPPKNSGWLPGTGFANECKAEPLADNHLSSRGVVGFEPAPHIQRIEEKKHRHRAENAPDPPPKSSKNGGRCHSFGCPEGLGGTPKVDLKRDPVPERKESVSGPPFFIIFCPNGVQNGGPFFPEWPWGQGSLCVYAEPLGSLDRPHARDHGKELLFGKNRHFLL